MKTAARNISSISETLNARKTHLTTLLTIVDTNIGKNTSTQKLTITAINAELTLIEHNLKKR